MPILAALKKQGLHSQAFRIIIESGTCSAAQPRQLFYHGRGTGMLRLFKQKKRSISSFQIIILSFLALILLGTLLLMLPFASRQNHFTPFADALFTAVSATCVTGLIVQDTATYWSFFGQAVIISLIQIGGMGVITIGLTVMRASGMKIGLWHRSTMQESVAAPHVGGMVRYSGFILKTSALIELIGGKSFRR